MTGCGLSPGLMRQTNEAIIDETVLSVPTGTPYLTYTAQPTYTLPPTLTSLPTYTTIPTYTALPTYTFQPTRTPKPSYTPFPTNTKQFTYTPLPTGTAQHTYTPFPTDTMQPAYTLPPTYTFEPTLTPKPSYTPFPTNTKQFTYTPLPTNTVQQTYTPLPTNTIQPAYTLFPTYTIEPTKTPIPMPTSIFSSMSVDIDSFFNQGGNSSGNKGLESVGLIDHLYLAGSNTLQNINVGFLYQDFKNLIMSAQNLLDFWDTFNFETIETDFSNFSNEFIRQLAIEEFPGELIKFIFTIGQSLTIPQNSAYQASNNFYLTISENEYMYFPEYSIVIEGEDIFFYNLEGEKIGKIIKEYSPDKPDEISFMIESFLNEITYELQMVSKDSELCMFIDTDKVFSLKIDSAVKAVTLLDVLSDTQLTVSFDPELHTITFANPGNGLLNTVEIFLDKQKKKISVNFLYENLFFLTFADQSRILLGVPDQIYLITFDDENHQIHFLPGSNKYASFDISFSDQSDLVSLTSDLYGKNDENLYSIKFDKEKSALSFFVGDSLGGGITFNKKSEEIILSDGISATVINNEWFDNLINGSF